MEILKPNKKIMMYSLMKAAVDATFRFCMLNVLIVFYDGEKVDNSSGLSQSIEQKPEIIYKSNCLLDIRS